MSEHKTTKVDPVFSQVGGLSRTLLSSLVWHVQGLSRHVPDHAMSSQIWYNVD